MTLTTKWVQGILKSLDWVKRRSATAKREMNPSLYEELTFTWKRKTANVIFKQIHNEIIRNFDQTPVGFTVSNKTTFAEKGAQSVPVANVDNKRQITGTFCVNVSSEFLSIQLIYSGVTVRCYRK